MIVVDKNVKYMRIARGFHRRGGVKCLGLGQKLKHFL